jgi:hypothetical protein
MIKLIKTPFENILLRCKINEEDIKITAKNAKSIVGFLELSWNFKTDYGNIYITGAFLHDFRNMSGVKGLGKFMLCTAINIGLSEKYLKKNRKIYLEANGGNCKELVTYTDEEIIKFFKDYPKEVMFIKRTYDVDDIFKMNKDDIFLNICRIKDNLKLVNYYQRYGFKVHPEAKGRGSAILMVNDINSVYNHCENKENTLSFLDKIINYLKSINTN